MIYGIIGENSTIAEEFRALANDGPQFVGYNNALSCDRVLICTGYLAGQSLREISEQDLDLTWQLNFVQPARFCDQLFEINPRARVCVLGSESGFSGSYDMAYAGAKAALHCYVRTKRLAHPEQMLVAIAPHIIWDTRMTQRRKDLPELEARGAGQRMGRWLNAMEVAQEALALLRGSPALSGSIVRMRVS